MNAVLEKISNLGIVPVIALDDKKDAAPLAKALCDGGLPCAEITFRTNAAEESIYIMSSEYPNMLVGAGTVLTTEQVDRAIHSGAKFIVSPGFNPTVVQYCMEKKIPIIPGCATPSDIEQAMSFELDVVKFFPAEAAGGLNMIKAMSAPYGTIKFMPTGGIHANNLTSYLDFDKVIACGGSWMVKNNLIKSGDFAGITKLVKEAVTSMLGFELQHIGINAKEEKEADATASLFEKMFGFEKKIDSSSIFAGTGIEIMKSPYVGSNGHIAIQTNYIERAIYHLEQQGFEFDINTTTYNEKKQRISIYFKQEINGFALRLVQRI